MADTTSAALANLRHLYANLKNGAVRDTASAKRIAEGLLAPAIAALESQQKPPTVVDDTTSAAQNLLPCPFCGAPAGGYAIEAHEHSAQLKAIGIPDHGGSYVVEGNCQCGSGLIGDTQEEVTARWNRRAHPTPPAVVEPEELSPDFTDTARAALMWVLWHHQGGSSPVGQSIRFALGMGQHDRLNEHQLAEAKRWERLHPVNPAVWARRQEPMSKEQRRILLDHLGARAEGLDGETWDQMVIDAVEAIHGIKNGDRHA